MQKIRGFYTLAAVMCAAFATPVAADGFMGFQLLELGGARVKWRPITPDKPLTLTYTVVDRAMTFPEARNCGAMVPLNATLARSDVDEADFAKELHVAFAMWSDVANIEFRSVPPGTPADILIGAQHNPVGFAFTDVHYVRTDVSFNAIDRSLICLNPQKQWKIGFDGDLSRYDLRYTIAHEIGHAIGLDHPGATGQMMAFKYDEHFRQLQHGDIEGVTKIYGARLEAPIDFGSNENRGVDYASAPTR